VYRYFRFGIVLGLLWFTTVQSPLAFAMNSTLGANSDTASAQGSVQITVPKGRSPVGSLIDDGAPEPGIVALLGFGLILLALSFVRTDRAGRKLGNTRSEGQKMVDNSASKGIPL
jgi:hypothetical protein